MPQDRTNATGIRMRPALYEDAEQLFLWRNQLDVRKYSRNQEIIDLATHVEWFSNNLEFQGSKSRIYLFHFDQTPIGMTRLDEISDGILEISIILDSNFRNKGLGKVLVQETCNYSFLHLNASTIMAAIHVENRNSLKLFQALGFEPRHLSQGFQEFFYTRKTI